MPIHNNKLVVIKCITFLGFYSNCSSSQFMCKTGVCIERSKRCNLAKDCFHGDDEEHCGK